MDLSDEIYSGNFYSLLKTYEQKKAPLTGARAFLEKVNPDLSLLRSKRTTAPKYSPEDFEDGHVRAKEAELQPEFEGQSVLLLLHALVIAILRKKDPPQVAKNLFLKLWTEEGQFLADNLSVRWKISAATTFADYGSNYEQRTLGMGLATLFDSIKMHDSERRLSGQRGQRPFKRIPSDKRHSLAFGMVAYSLTRGDLDRNMLARFWSLAESDVVIFPLAKSMLDLIMYDNRSIFARLQRLKPKKENDSALDLIEDH